MSRADLEQIERGLDEWLQQHKIDDRYGYNGASWQEPCTLNLMPGSAKALLDFIRAGLYQ